jgi:Lrp/AsnC family leucine-responsive transcriptional regulator
MLDSYDHAILRLVQEDNQRTHAEIGEAVHLSASSVRRRLARLRGEGVIHRDVSILDPDLLGITVIVMVTFQEETLAGVRSFKQRMVAAPEVSQCYSVAGGVDYVVIAHAPDLASYERWAERTLMDDPAIRRYDTHVAWSRVKFTTALPLAGDEAGR